MRKFRGLLIVLGVIALIAIFFVSTYNSLVNMEEDVDNAWAQVQTSYQRRADLIPNLVETVKGYAKHESEVFENIAKLRSGYSQAKSPEEYNELDKKLQASIQVAVEAYPELKANQNFLALQDELAGTENRIAVARRDFNNAATAYNKSIRRFPRNILANMFGFEQRERFAAEEGAQNAPKVDFGKGK